MSHLLEVMEQERYMASDTNVLDAAIKKVMEMKKINWFKAMGDEACELYGTYNYFKILLKQ